MRPPFRLLLLAAAVAVSRPAPLAAQQDAAATAADVRAWVRAHDVAILGELRDLLAIPNVASDSTNIRRNAAHLAGMLERRGFRTRLLEAPGSRREVPPAVFGELVVPGATRTIVFYAHYDGQPVTRSQWADDPWAPTLRTAAVADGGERIPFPTTSGSVQGEWRLHARSASDDKSPIVALLQAIDALGATGRRPTVNVKVFLDGEEEAGSEHMAEIVAAHRELLGADVWLFGDGPVHQSRAMQVVFGVRGVTGLELTVYGPRRPLHSGHYGNWAPNPAVLLTHLLASMRSPEGDITIAGFGDDVIPLGALERAAIDAVPSPDSALRQELLLGDTEGNGAPLAERIMLPALNVRGIRAGAVGDEAANAIMTQAHASIDFRLVPRQTPQRVREVVEAHVRAQGFHIVAHEPTPEERLAHPRIARLEWGDGYPGVRTPLDLPISRSLLQVVERTLGAPPVVVPMLGGSLPIESVSRLLGAPLIVLPMVNHDNNQHGANENLRLQNLFDGIVLYAGVLAGMGPDR